MKRAEWNATVLAYEAAIRKAVAAGEEFARAEAQEDAAHDAAKNATDERKAAGYRRDTAIREAEAAVMAYGAAMRQRTIDGGTDEDRAEAARAQGEESGT